MFQRCVISIPPYRPYAEIQVLSVERSRRLFQTYHVTRIFDIT